MTRIQRRAFLRGVGGIAGGLWLKRTFGELLDAERIYALEGPFGRAEIDIEHPALVRLYLRQTNGEPASKSLLSECASDFPEWAVGATCYFVDEDGRRYESRHSTEHRWESGVQNQSLRIIGIRPRTSDGAALPCREDWTLSVTEEGGLRWQIDRRFQRSFKAACHGGPALFFNISPNIGLTKSTQKRLNPSRNAVAVTWWVVEQALVGEPVDLYRKPGSQEIFFPKNKSVSMRRKDGWAIFKVYTSFPHDQDLRIHAEGGHLYRRGMYWAFAEVGLSMGPAVAYDFEKGETTRLALEIFRESQLKTGQQLMVRLPDKAMERNLKSYFGGLANAGCLADCGKHLLGNECDGYLYAGNMWMHAYSLLASAPAEQPLSTFPVTYADAIRKTLQYNLDSVTKDGQITAGFTHGGEFPELPMMNIIGLEAYLLYSGDVEFARTCQPAIDRMERYLEGWMKDGLFCASPDRLKMPTGSINWYYDELRGAHGFTMYHNVNYVRTVRALATISTALGRLDKANRYARRRRQLIKAINQRFWDKSAYGRGRDGYVDWIHEDGDKGRYFFACNQYPAILHGVAGPARSLRLLATADARIRELKEYHNYTGEGTLDNLWPLKSGDIQRRNLHFGQMMDGGMLLCMTFWEVVARCRAGDADGAYRLLKNFSKRAGRTNWFEGVNAFSMNARPSGWDGDPFLADQLVAAASVVHGFLGLEYSWDNFTVTPHLPSSWDEISATIVFKGTRYTILATSAGRVLISQAV